MAVQVRLQPRESKKVELKTMVLNKKIKHCQWKKKKNKYKNQIIFPYYNTNSNDWKKIKQQFFEIDDTIRLMMKKNQVNNHLSQGCNFEVRSGDSNSLSEIAKTTSKIQLMQCLGAKINLKSVNPSNYQILKHLSTKIPLNPVVIILYFLKFIFIINKIKKP